MKTAGSLFLAAQAGISGPIALLIAVVIIAVILVVYSLMNKKPGKPPAVQPIPLPEEPEAKPEPIHFYKPEEIGVDDGELIAVLTAAIVAATGKSSSSFRVVSFKRKGDWAGNALRESINK